MKPYYLYGFEILFGCESSFCIPLFNKIRGGNQLYEQKFSEDLIVQYFSEHSGEGEIRRAKEVLKVTEGDPAFFAFYSDTTGNIHTGNQEVLSKELVAEIEVQEFSPQTRLSIHEFADSEDDKRASRRDVYEQIKKSSGGGPALGWRSSQIGLPIARSLMVKLLLKQNAPILSSDVVLVQYFGPRADILISQSALQTLESLGGGKSDEIRRALAQSLSDGISQISDVRFLGCGYTGRPPPPHIKFKEQVRPRDIEDTLRHKYSELGDIAWNASDLVLDFSETKFIEPRALQSITSLIIRRKLDGTNGFIALPDAERSPRVVSAFTASGWARELFQVFRIDLNKNSFSGAIENSKPVNEKKVPLDSGFQSYYTKYHPNKNDLEFTELNQLNFTRQLLGMDQVAELEVSEQVREVSKTIWKFLIGPAIKWRRPKVFQVQATLKSLRRRGKQWPGLDLCFWDDGLSVGDVGMLNVSLSHLDDEQVRVEKYRPVIAVEGFERISNEIKKKYILGSQDDHPTVNEEGQLFVPPDWFSHNFIRITDVSNAEGLNFREVVSHFVLRHGGAFDLLSGDVVVRLKRLNDQTASKSPKLTEFLADIDRDDTWPNLFYGNTFRLSFPIDPLEILRE